MILFLYFCNKAKLENLAFDGDALSERFMLFSALSHRCCYRFVVYPPFIRQTNKISAIYPPTLSLYLVPFFSPTFLNIFSSVKDSKSREAVLSEVSQML